MNSKALSPKVGQSVLFHRDSEGTCLDANQPMLGVVTFVHARNCVNLSVLDHAGHSIAVDKVPVLDHRSPELVSLPYCELRKAEIDLTGDYFKTGCTD